MFYDLNQYVEERKGVDTFTWDGVPYEIGPLTNSDRLDILAIDANSDIFAQWRPIVARLLDETNQHTPELTEAFLGAFIPIILKKYNEDHPRV